MHYKYSVHDGVSVKLNQILTRYLHMLCGSIGKERPRTQNTVYVRVKATRETIAVPDTFGSGGKSHSHTLAVIPRIYAEIRKSFSYRSVGRALK